ncbi:GcrA family cell cycle regulator, partial [Caldovatus aquaticus]
MEWSVEAIETLRALWAEGLSTAEIGRRMGVSKNAVVGKAHRLNLPPRPSPIRRDPAAPRMAAPRAAAVRAAAMRAPAPFAAPRRPLPGLAVGPAERVAAAS